MKELRTTEIKLFGAFFLVAGLFGLYTFLGLVFPLDDLVSVINIFPTVLFGLALYSGYLLLIQENAKGLEIGRAVIALQVVHFQIAGIGYLFVTGPFIFVGFANLNFGMNIGLDNNFIIRLSDAVTDVVFRINILALSIFLYLTRLIKKIDEKMELQESVGIGTMEDSGGSIDDSGLDRIDNKVNNDH